jgi:hypothetical protein
VIEQGRSEIVGDIILQHGSDPRWMRKPCGAMVAEGEWHAIWPGVKHAGPLLTIHGAVAS